MVEENKQAQAQPAETSDASRSAAPQREVKAASRIPMTSIAVMIFILLVAFLCVGVQVVVGVVEEKNAPVEIKGKEGVQPVEYPVLSTLPEGVAAEVNGVEIPESQITDHIMKMRSSLGAEDQEAWDEWMIENKNTTELLRLRIIIYFVNDEAVDQMADEMGIVPTQEDIDAVREEVYSDPENVAELEQVLAREGRTLEDYENELPMIAKRKLIGQAEVEKLKQTADFENAVLAVIKQRNPQYADVTALDQIDNPELIEATIDELAALNLEKAFGERAHEFLENSDIYYSKMPSDLPYKSNSDTYFMKEAFKEMLNKNGIFIGKGGLFDSLDAQADEEVETE